MVMLEKDGNVAPVNHIQKRSNKEFTFKGLGQGWSFSLGKTLTEQVEQGENINEKIVKDFTRTRPYRIIMDVVIEDDEQANL